MNSQQLIQQRQYCLLIRQQGSHFVYDITATTHQLKLQCSAG